MNEERFIDEPLKIEERSLEDGSKAEFISGSGIVFDKWSKTMTMELKTGQRVQFVEKIEKRALDGVDLSNVESMVDHKFLLGKRSKGTMDVSVTDTAVIYSVRVPNTTIGNDAKENIRNGNLEGSSFQFGLARGGDSWNKDVTPYQRTIHKFSFVSEMGPVSRPAYGDTTAALRSLEEFEKGAEPVHEIDYKTIERKLKLFGLGEKRAMHTQPNMQAMIKALNDCQYACENNIYVCIKMNYQKCLSLCRDCADICQLCALLCARNSKYLPDIMMVCQQVCNDCYNECKKYEECQECAKYCKICADMCKSMMK